jgi:hypothetical protein
MNDCTMCDKTYAEHAEGEHDPTWGMTFEEIEAEAQEYWNQMAKDSEAQYIESLRASGKLTEYDERLWI